MPKTIQPTFSVQLAQWDARSSIARVEIHSAEAQLLDQVLGAARRHWGARRFKQAVTDYLKPARPSWRTQTAGRGRA